MQLSMHVLNGRPKGLLFDRCIESVKKTGLDFSVIENQGHSVLEGRFKGFDCPGTHITWVDDDDETLLLPEHLNSGILDTDHLASFTNSEMACGTITNCVPSWISDWSLGYEKLRMCRPHPTMILENDFANKTLRETEKLMLSKNWEPNFCDYVFRLIISTTIGWKYIPITTYRWYIHPDNLHKKDIPGINEIKKYFFESCKS